MLQVLFVFLQLDFLFLISFQHFYYEMSGMLFLHLSYLGFTELLGHVG